MGENNCLDPKHCDVALALEKIHGEIKSQLSAGTEIMKSLRASQECFNERVEKILEKQDQRIGIVEKKTWYAAGAVSAITAAVTAVTTRIFGGGSDG